MPPSSLPCRATRHSRARAVRGSSAPRVLFLQHYDDCPPGLLGDRLVELGVTPEVVSARAARLPDPTGFDLVVPLGSHDSVLDDSLPYVPAEVALLERAIAADVPVFGICFGAQLLCRVLGGTVRRMPEPEIGLLPVRTADPGLVGPGPWLVWHLDDLAPGPGSVAVARTGRAVQAFAHGPHAGVQFHPEVTVETLRVWTERYRDAFDRLALDPGTVLAQAEQERAAARRRAFLLADHLLTRATTRPLRTDAS
jgi:GMP synthase (glutamine-hydrolysing)